MSSTHYTVAGDLNETLASEAANTIKMTAGTSQIMFAFIISQYITWINQFLQLIDRIYKPIIIAIYLTFNIICEKIFTRIVETKIDVEASSN